MAILGCGAEMKALMAVSDEDVEAIETALAERLRMGVPRKEAQVQAVDEAIALVAEERREVEAAIEAKDAPAFARWMESPEDINELGAFNVDGMMDPEYADSFADGDKDVAAELEADGFGVAGGKRDVAWGSEVTPKAIKAAGFMPESLYGYPQFSGDANGDFVAKVQAGSHQRTMRIQPYGAPDNNQWKAAIGGLGVEAAWGQPLSFSGVSFEAATDYLNRFAASIDLTAKKFDLAKAVPTDAAKRIGDFWTAAPRIDGATEFSISEPTLNGKSSDKLRQIGKVRLMGSGYELTDVESDGNMLHVHLSKGGKYDIASIEISRDKVGGQQTVVLHTAGMQKGSGVGKAFYSIANSWAKAMNLKVAADPEGLTAVNAVRRTENALSSAARTGGEMLVEPGYAQRVYGFDGKAKTPEAQRANLVRLALAQLRNVRELAPGFDGIAYNTETETFERDGESAEAEVKALLKAPDVRQFSLGRSSFIRAALTQALIDGEVALPDSLNSPILYSRGGEAAQQSRAAIDRQRRSQPMVAARQEVERALDFGTRVIEQGIADIGKTEDRLPLLLGPVPHTIKMLTKQNAPLVMDASILRKVFIDKHAEDFGSITPKELMRAMHNPVLVLRDPKDKTEYQLILPLVGRDGPMTMPVVSSAAGEPVQVNIKSIYSRPLSDIAKAIEMNRAVYADMNTAPEVLDGQARFFSSGTTGVTGISDRHDTPQPALSSQRQPKPDAYRQTIESPTSAIPGSAASVAGKAPVGKPMRLQFDLLRAGITAGRIKSKDSLTAWIEGNFKGDPDDAPAFSRAEDTPEGREGPAFTLPEFGIGSEIIASQQNRYNRWKQVVAAVREQGGVVNEVNDFYQAEERYWGKVGAKIEDFQAEVRDFTQAVLADDIELADVATYAYAQHAKERNAFIAGKRPGMPDGGSGMTDEYAQSLLDSAKEAGLDEALQKHATTLRSWIGGTREHMLAEGLIDQAEHDAWKSMFDYYVPLRGLEELAKSGGGSGLGRGFNIRGKEAKVAKGRRSEAKRVIEQVIEDRTKALIRGGKNEVLRSFLQFALDNPSNNLWEVEAVERKPVTEIDSQGNRIIVERTAIVGDDRTVAVKDGGRQINILIRDETLLRQLQNLDDEKLGAFIGGMAHANRFLGRLYTSLNPVFTVTNFARDLPTGMMATLDKLGFRGAAKYLGAIPEAMVEAARAEMGMKPSKDYELYRASGGKTAFFGFKTVDDLAEDLAMDVTRAQRGKLDPRNLGAKALEVIEAVNGVFENTTRLAVFKAARRSGRSLAESATITKNATTNFNRRGNASRHMAAWFLFYNPAVQGTSRLVEALQSPKVLSVLGAGMTGMALLAMQNADMGDDDDGIAWWDKIPSSVKERNIVIVLPPTSKAGEAIPGSKTGRYIKVPMPYGYNFFAGAANQAVDVARNARDPKRGAKMSEAGIRLFNTFTGAFVPVSELGRSIEEPKSLALLAVPDFLNPVAQSVLNVNAFGKKMYPDDRTSEHKPDSEKYFAGLNGSMYQKAAAELNRVSGGSKFEAGALDFAPASLESIVRSYGGGPASFVADIANTFYAKSIERPDAEWRRAPFAKQLYGVIDAETDRASGYDRMAKVEAAVKPYEAAKKAGDAEAAQSIVDAAGPMVALGDTLQQTQKALSTLRKAELAIMESKDSDGAKSAKLDALNGQRRMVIQQFNRAYNSALDMGKSKK